MGKSKQISAEYKMIVALAALCGGMSLTELVSRYGVPGRLVKKWAQEARESLLRVFKDKPAPYQARHGERRRLRPATKAVLSPEERNFFDHCQHD